MSYDNMFAVVNPSNPTLELKVRISIGPDDDDEEHMWHAGCAVMLGDRYWLSETNVDISEPSIASVALFTIFRTATENALRELGKERSMTKRKEKR